MRVKAAGLGSPFCVHPRSDLRALKPLNPGQVWQGELLIYNEMNTKVVITINTIQENIILPLHRGPYRRASISRLCFVGI